MRIKYNIITLLLLLNACHWQHSSKPDLKQPLFETENTELSELSDESSDWIRRHITQISKDAADLDTDILGLALASYKNAFDHGLTNSPILSVVDFTKESKTPRLWVIDLSEDRVLFHELVAHGKNSGDHFFATRFSNSRGSRQSSLGLFLTGNSYIGSRGHSLKLHGLEKGVNDNALPRGIVFHGASYVSETMAKERGHIGRSFGCLSLRPKITRELIDTIKGGSVVFAYHSVLEA